MGVRDIGRAWSLDRRSPSKLGSRLQGLTQRPAPQQSSHFSFISKPEPEPQDSKSVEEDSSGPPLPPKSSLGGRGRWEGASRLGRSLRRKQVGSHEATQQGQGPLPWPPPAWSMEHPLGRAKSLLALESVFELGPSSTASLPSPTYTVEVNLLERNLTR